MTRLSSRQYAMWKRMPDDFGILQARKYNQTTLGSFATRGWLVKHGSSFHKTRQGHEEADAFGHEEIFRKLISDRISIHFKEWLKLVKTA